MNREREEAIKTLENMKKGLYPWYHDEVLDMAIHALQQEPCEDAISREAAIDYLITNMSWYSEEGYETSEEEKRECITSLINAIPPVRAEKTGHWILLDECSNSGYYCSECHKKVVKEGWSETVKKIKFCPNCGIKILPQPYKGESEG